MGDLKQQHVCIRFCFKRGKSDAETFEMMQVAFGEQTVFAWFSEFGSGMTFAEGAKCLRRTSTCWTIENVDRVKQQVPGRIFEVLGVDITAGGKKP